MASVHGSAFLLGQILHDRQCPAGDVNGTGGAVSLYVLKHPKGPVTMPPPAHPNKWDRISPYMRPHSSGAVFTVMGRPCGIGSSCPTVVICSRPGSGDDLGRLVWVMGTSGLDFSSGKKGEAAPQIHLRNGAGQPIVSRLTLSLNVNGVAG